MTIDFTPNLISRSLVMLFSCFLLSFSSISPAVANGSLDRTGDGIVSSADLAILLTEVIQSSDSTSMLFEIADAWGLETGPATINFQEYFPLSQNSNWTYVGFNGGSTEDNFTWTVEGTYQDVGSGIMATRIRTDTQEPTDDRNLDVDFWYCNTANGEVYFYGLHIGSVKGSGLFTVPVQDIVLTDPLLVGTQAMQVGVAAPSDSAAASVILNTPFGTKTFTGTLSVSINPTGIIPVFNTPLGNFTDVLRVVINISATVYGQTYSFENSTFFLKKGIGMVAQDQQPDVDDAELQGIQSGQVGGVTIVAN